MASRPLNLHVSALNDAEYDLYTTSLADITLSDNESTHDDAYFETLSVSVREARAWLRGRYSHISAATLDSILRFFSPTDMLSGGQFFAAIRLVVHAESGREVDRTLAFVQAHPTSTPISRPGSPPKPHAFSVPPVPSRRSSDSTNPFSTVPQHSNHNPFSSARSTSARSDGPPLPPRKLPPPIPGFQPPPKHGGNPPPPPPPKPSFPHVTSTLIKQSLIASKNGKTIKQAEEQIEKTRVLRVLKSSERARSSSPNKLSSSASSSSHTSESDRAPPLPKRNKKPPSPPLSISSFQQVALASHNPFNSIRSNVTNSPSTSPSQKPADLPPLPAGPPPKHPDQNSNHHNLSYRKPPPPIPPNLPSSTSASQHQRTPSFTQFAEPEDAEPRDFEAIYGSTPKTASPYIGAFARIPQNSPRDGNYFGSGDNSPSPGRMFRSKSLHHPSPPSLASRLATIDSGDVEQSPFSPLDDETPLASPAGTSPAPRRKRPESVQVFGSNTTSDWNASRLGGGVASPTGLNLSRHMSLNTTPSPPSAAATLRRQQQQQLHQRQLSPGSNSTTSSDSPLKSLAASLQPQLSSMQQQLQPHLDKARYKAEAGLSKRGFVRDHVRRSEEQEGLMTRDGGWQGHSRNGGGIIDGDEYSLSDSESEEDSYGPKREGGRGRQGSGEGNFMPNTVRMNTGVGVGRAMDSRVGVGIEKDNLKWPVAEGEGWAPL